MQNNPSSFPIEKFVQPQKARLYFELHITCEALEGAVGRFSSGPFEQFADFAEPLGWRASRFGEDHVDEMHGKWFLSARETELEAAKHNLVAILGKLKRAGYTVLRWKIEDTVLDSKYGDTLDGLD